MKLLPFLLWLICPFSGGLWAQTPSTDIEKQKYQTVRVAESELRFDGILDEAAWDRVAWGDNFIVFDPDNGAEPAHETQFKILFTDKYLVVGYRAFIDPDSIVARMGRRDEFPGDWCEINIDSYHDLRTAFSFTYSVSGVRNDEFVSDNGNNWDTNWNPIWDGRPHIDSLGWTAEIRIPFSQLRYSAEENPVWGLQVMRRDFRRAERSTYQHVPQNGSGYVSRFAELHGLNNLPKNKQIEIAPYIVAKTERFAAESGNPFADGSRNGLTAGLDGKLAVTRDMILDFTINPDFGQVEADPGAVRLDGYEVFFSERRPFFMESRNLFDYQLTGSEADGDYNNDQLFYSRRIGGAPHGYPNIGTAEFAKVPQQTTILGAAKFSGKTKNGLSVGILESVTQREMATIDLNGERRSELVEPLTSYFVGRVMKDYDEGNTVIGGVFSAVNRENGLENIHKSAYSGGIDVLQFWKDKAYQLKGNLLFSHVEGSAVAIAETQSGFVHYFQRPNAKHLDFDPTRTALTGTGGTLRFSKFGGKLDSLGGMFKYETGVTWRSPQLELNDIGFLLAADEINHFTWFGYQIRKPFSVFRSLNLHSNYWQRWDFGGLHLYQAYNVNSHASFKNNWNLGGGFTWNPSEISNNALRGGSSLRRPSGKGGFAYIGTDERKKVQLNLNTFQAWGDGNTVRVEDYSVSLQAQPFDALQISLSPGYNRAWRRQDQFVTQRSFNNQIRTIVGEVEQQSLYLTLRLNYNITPNLTLQYYGQPYIFRAKYANFGYVADPMSKSYDSRFHVFTGDEISHNVNGEIYVDENADDNVDYYFHQPDFNYIQFRSNLVARWEYTPGSEAYLVWSQGGFPDAYDDLSTPISRSLFDNMFSQTPQNIFLVKLMYRLVR